MIAKAFTRRGIASKIARSGQRPLLSCSTRAARGLDQTPVDLLPIIQLKRAAADNRIEARVHAQLESLTRKDTREGKPFYTAVFADAEAKLTLRAWSDAPAFEFCERAREGAFVEIAGEFSSGTGFGLDAKRWTVRELKPDELAELIEGPADLRSRQAADFAFIEQTTRAITDPRLAALCGLFFADFGDRFRRAAAARNNHHARRGGLVEHVAQMMRSAMAIASAYPALNRDLLAAGVLFHDCGKLWENQMPAEGFAMPFDERGELLGHITIGIELVNTLWRKLQAAPEWAGWLPLDPASEDVRLHLLHLLASHHGELQFGSPVVPKTPEAWALHYVDNLDAKMEMMHAAYATSKHLAARIQEKVWPLPGNLVEPLAHFPQPPAADSAA
ncbi:MAG: HD domain-containing protein [Chthoniobacteraceae bacterium]